MSKDFAAGYFDAPFSSRQNDSAENDGENEPHLNIRSCVTCRKRKVRCDKREPACGNCVKAKIECIFPAPGRAPRKARKPPDAELLKRLRTLEGMVQSLGAQVDESKPKDNAASPDQPSRQSSIARVAADTSASPEHCPIEARIKTEGKDSGDIPLGKLVISEGKSRYVNNAYWASIGSEIADIRDILDQSDSEDDDHHSPESKHDGDVAGLHGFMFGFSSLAVDMKRLYPSPSQIFIIWEIFKENIDPVVKVLHCPSVRNLILKAAVNTDDLSRPTEALFFSICLGSVVSMPEDQCLSLLGEAKSSLWKRYRFATEQALARADLLNSSSLVVLQAFIFYLICLRYYDDSKSVWALGGLAIHQAYTQGLHRDGTNFSLPPFEIEMRRRLWWHIALLDIRAAEDHGTEIRAKFTVYDTKFPSNIDDNDIWPGMKDPPTPREGPTEMTFCLVRFELMAMTWKLSLFSPHACLLSEQAIKAKEKLIDDCHRQIENKYIKDSDLNQPIHWVAATVSRLILAKMWLKLHHPRLSEKSLREDPDLRDRVFTTSIEVIEFGRLLEANENTAKWGWLFRTYMQWHAVAYVLSEICLRPASSEVDRAWRAVEAVYEESEHSKKQRGMLWKPIRQLMVRAKKHQAEIAQRGAVENLDMTWEQNPWMLGDTSVIASTADALGLNVQDTSMMSDLSNTMDNTGMGFNDASMLKGLPMTPPDTHITQGSTPDFFAWDGWSPSVGQFTVGPMTAQPFETEFMKEQEWF